VESAWTRRVHVAADASPRFASQQGSDLIASGATALRLTCSKELQTMPRFSQADYIAYLARRKASEHVQGKADDDEAGIHEAIISECRRLGLYYVHNRMDKPSTATVGAPDFIIALPHGKTLWIEAKSRQGKLRTEQAAAAVWLAKLGHNFRIVRSMAEAIRCINDAIETAETENGDEKHSGKQQGVL